MKSAFKSGNRRVYEAWTNYLDAHREINLRRREFAARLGHETVMVNRLGFGHGTRVVGLPGGTYGEARTPPEGWRYSPRAGHLVPDKRTRLGKTYAEEMAALNDPDLALPGMPSFQVGGGGFGMAVHAPAIFEHGDVVYVGWGLEAEAISPVEAKWWKPIPLSQYYSVVEAHEADEKKPVSA